MADKSFKDIIDSEDCKRPLEEFNTMLGLNCHAWDTLGKPILPPIWGNTLCKAIKSVQPGLLTCAGSHKEMTREAKVTGQPVIRKCHAGLVKAVVPVIVDGKYMGMIGGCGSLPRGEKVDQEYIKELAAKIGVAEEYLSVHLPSVGEVDVDDVSAKVREALDSIGCVCKG
ncbi:MAG TPA: PocR ligand-binding domain-containing protein [Nitrospirota bacterium]